MPGGVGGTALRSSLRNRETATRVWVRGHLPMSARTAPAPPDRHQHAPEPAGAGFWAIRALIACWIGRWGWLTRVWVFKPSLAALAGPAVHLQAA